MDIEIIRKQQDYINESFELLKRFINDLSEVLEKNTYNDEKWEVRVRRNFENKITPYERMNFWDYELKICRISEPRYDETNHPIEMFPYYIVKIGENFIMDLQIIVLHSNIRVGVFKLKNLLLTSSAIDLTSIYINSNFAIEDFCSEIFRHTPNLFSLT